ncbi:MAG TPA: helix-turn-helix domain-containing protein [Silvibacterium sp.]|nr:helix-turn-helix domain-containing protein [Silvibacterium sp.]
MKLADKFRYLREVEGSLRGLNRAMTQRELLRAIQAETGGGISQSYLSQIESGARPHLTNTTRLLLARFFKVHPGYLVDDPEGYHAELLSDARALEDKLDLWLIGGAERFRRDPKLCRALLTLARHAESRNCLLLLESILETPSLAERLLQLLRPEAVVSSSPESRVGNGKPTSQTQDHSTGSGQVVGHPKSTSQTRDVGHLATPPASSKPLRKKRSK